MPPRLVRSVVLPASAGLSGDAGGGAATEERLWAAAEAAEAKVERALLEDCRRIRRDLYELLRRGYPAITTADLLGYTQAVVGRLVFLVMAIRRGLLPERDLESALLWLEQGDPELVLPAIDGLPRFASAIESLDIRASLCEGFAALAGHDFTIDALGRLFELAISDFEELDSGGPRRASARRAQGIFFTPASITRLIVDKTLGRALSERFEALSAELRPDKGGGQEEQNRAWIALWERYRRALASVRVLDPACGAGALLMAAYDTLAREYERADGALASLGRPPVDASERAQIILKKNLFGIDLDAGAVELAKLSLWLKAGLPRGALGHLGSNIRQGNSVVSDPGLCSKAFDWSIDDRFREGFDVVLGNPPYVRQERLTPMKPHFKADYEAYHGMADIYIYFFERGLRALRPGGRLAYIVPNKWLRAGYAEELRRILAARTELESLIDFGHAPLFRGADTFPCIVALRKLDEGASAPPDHQIRVTSFSRRAPKGVGADSTAHRHAVPQSRLGAQAWSLEPPAVDSLMAKIARDRASLVEYAGVRPLRGLMTGLNDAFLVNSATRERLVKEDPASARLLHPCLRGRDVARWAPEPPDAWLVLLKSSADFVWPWSGLAGAEAESSFRAAFPAIYRHLKPMEASLRKRTDKGRHWWELRSCAYYAAFSEPKIFYQEIQFHNAYCADIGGLFSANKAFLLPSADQWLLAVLSSPLLWWHNWRYLPHMKDETLTPVAAQMERLPIAPPTPAARDEVESLVPKLLSLVRQNNEARLAALESLRARFDVETPGKKLEDFASLDVDSFMKLALARRPTSIGGPKAETLKDLRRLYLDQAPGIQERRRDTRRFERRLATLVNEAYSLTPEEVDLMWSTAPPRMPEGR